LVGAPVDGRALEGMDEFGAAQPISSKTLSTDAKAAAKQTAGSP